jgi:hypothetical protein
VKGEFHAEAAVDFARLRRRGIALAQAHSGAVWTDFNVHDPGVTLLEAIAFALTEVAYRADFPTEDLLAGPDGPPDLGRQHLGPPLAVLPSRPVTARDLALALSDSHAAVQRVLVRPCRGSEAGLYDLHVVPAADADPAVALAAVERGFHANRNLCEDLRTLALATPVPCRLEARIEVRRRHPPERLAALVYDRCRRLMRDRGAARPRPPATRRDVFDDPAAVHAHLADPDGGAPALDFFFADLNAVEEVEDVLSLSFRRLDGTDAFAPIAAGQYRELLLPADPGEIGLVLVSRDLELPFDLEAMRAELRRLRAGHVAELGDALDREDWAPARAGRHRDFAHLPLGQTLPAAYGAGAEGLLGSAAPQTVAEAGQLRGYLAIADAALANTAADLAGLAELFSGDPAAGRSYQARPLDFGPMPELAAGAPGAVAASIAALDPWQDRIGRVLDHLLALQGEECSQNSLRLHDLYHDPAGRQAAILENRIRLLREVPALNHGRSAGPNVAAGERCHMGGLGRKLALLLDFPDRGTAPISAAVRRTGLALVDGLGPAGDWTLPRGAFSPADDPFAALVSRREVPPPDPAGLLAATAFLGGRVLGSEVLRRGIAPAAYLLAPDPGGGWRLVLDPDDGETLLDVGRFTDRDAAVRHANALRVFLTDLNRRSEGAHVVEDILLRGEDGAFAPMALTVAFAGWSARTRSPGFRRLAEETAALLCPAHIAHRVVWLDCADMAALEALLVDWRVALRDSRATPGGPRADDLPRAGATLRAFLAAQP